MSLTRKRRNTGKTWDRSRQNGRKSRGEVTPAGKARAATARITSALRQLWRFTDMLVKVRNGALT
jgi:hypothetical protein